ncbi:MAG: hypothetical protein NWF06_02050 [Candidatus Bathyarchaeota archaeon]|nr:hypothetical protein [Candidatus Bathyarchaeum sp.]
MSEKIETFDIDNDEQVSVFHTPCMDKGKLAFKKVTKTHKYSKIQGRFKLARKKTEIVSFESVNPDLKDTISLPLLIKRSAIDTEKVQNVEAFFKTTSTITVHNPDLKLSISDGKPFLHTFLDNGQCVTVATQYISPVLPNNNLYTIEIDGNYQRVSYDEAVNMTHDGVMVFVENPASRHPANRFRVVLNEA